MFGLMTLALPQSGPFIEITPEVPFRKQITGFSGSEGAGATGTAALGAALGFGAADGVGAGAGTLAAAGALDAAGGGRDGAADGAG